MVTAGQKRVQISIRAPTRGATNNAQSDYFFEIFQSALPRGERLICCSKLLHLAHFNPRSHEGSDNIATEQLHHTKISIRAPTRGATITDSSSTQVAVISIRAPTRGATSIVGGAVAIV